MTKQDICGAGAAEQALKDLYDSKPDMTLAQLSRISGKSVAQLKQILMGSN